MMKNHKVAGILNWIADYLEMEGQDFRIKAYHRAANTIESLSKDVEDVRDEDKLQELPGIGKSIARKIEEIIDTGTLQYYEELKKQAPVDFEALLEVEGLGPRTIKLLYEELGVQNLDDLEREAKRHHIRRLKGMGDKSERKILDNLEFARKSTGRKLLGYVLPLARELIERFENLDNVDRAEIAGSIRRRKETVGDMDILVITQKSREIMDLFTEMEFVEDVIVKGDSKSTVRLNNGLETDLRVFTEDEFGSAFLYFTGSKETNIALRKIAIKKGLKLNEYGVFRGDDQLASKTEEEIFKTLELAYIEPELRENRGEVEAAACRKLPNLVGYLDLRGDLQMHTNWSDGLASIKSMVVAGKQMDYEYLAITDHTGSLRIAWGMDEKRVKKQMEEIDQINQEIKGITILKGLEVNIDSEGKLDISNELLQDLDIVLAAVHSGFRHDKEKMTRRIVSAMENENVDIIAHPTGRKIQERRAYDLDFNQVFEVAHETDTILEINSQPNRLDLSDINIKRALESGCKLVISTDAHSPDQLSTAELGLANARRGWAEKKDIINTLPLKKLLKIFN